MFSILQVATNVVGASELIADGLVGLRAGARVQGLERGGVVLDTGEVLAADLLVCATGYGSMSRFVQIESIERVVNEHQEAFFTFWAERMTSRNKMPPRKEMLKELLEYANTVPEACRAAGCQNQFQLFQLLRCMNTKRDLWLRTVS